MVREYPNTTEESIPAFVGRKSEKTRHRIMEATKILFSQGKYTAKITDIARAAKIAQPHFYIYFSSVQDVIYAIAEEMYGTGSKGLPDSLDSDWTDEHGFSLACQTVEACLTKWQENYAINSICALLAGKEAGRFRELRARRQQYLCDLFAEKVRNAQRKGLLDSDIDPILRGHQCVGILNNMAQQYDSLIASGFSKQHIVEETANLLLGAVGANPSSK